MAANQPVAQLFWARTALVSCVVLLLSTLSCASINFAHVRVETPPPAGSVAQVVPGESSLVDCLSLLGAPTSVDKSDDEQSHFVLTWNWLEKSDWGFSMSIPVGDQSASFNWKDSESQPQFVQLFFDHNWLLVGKAEG